MANLSDDELNGETYVDSVSQLSEDEFSDAHDNLLTIEPSSQSDLGHDIRRREEESLLSQDELLNLKEQSIHLKDEGNCNFKKRDFTEAVSLYTEALKKCPLLYELELSTLHSNRAAARHHLAITDDDRKAVLADCNKSIELNPTYLKPLIKRAVIQRELGSEHLDESLADYKRIVELDPNNTIAKHAIFELTAEIEARNEKLKLEMMGKLKDLGNLCLKPFGLSTENFQLNQNPDTGGYSVNFKQ